MQERADGWGIIDGIPEDDLLGLATPSHEKTLLESGTTLSHHTKENCSGNCCLHGSSPHPSCRMPRQWRQDRGILEHVCPHGIGHPCYAGVDYVLGIGGHADAIHGCDGCCVVVDNRPNDPASVLNEVDHYTMLKMSNDIDGFAEQLGWIWQDMEELQDQLNRMRFWPMLSAFAIIAFVALDFILK